MIDREHPATTKEWRAASDPQWLFELAEDKISSRKIRLFAVACCRHTLPGSLTPLQERALETAEMHADRRATDEDLIQAHRALLSSALGQPQTPDDSPFERYETLVFEAVHIALYADFHQSSYTRTEVRTYGLTRYLPSAFESPYDYAIFTSLRTAAAAAARQGVARMPAALEPFLEKTYRDHADLLRTIVGDPFREVGEEFDRVVRKHPEIKLFAAEIYLSKSFGLTNRLASMLLDAGLDDAEIHREATSPGPFARGGWLVDLVLGID